MNQVWDSVAIGIYIYYKNWAFPVICWALLKNLYQYEEETRRNPRKCLQHFCLKKSLAVGMIEPSAAGFRVWREDEFTKGQLKASLEWPVGILDLQISVVLAPESSEN
jgi:hypothetical protein